MKKQIFVLLILFFAMNCSGSADPSPNLSPEASSDTVEGLPEWFLNSPEKDGFQYMAAEATSRQMQLAIDKARTDAVTSLSSMINSEWSGYVKRIQEETGIPVIIADDPLTCVARGGGLVLEMIVLLTIRQPN